MKYLVLTVLTCVLMSFNFSGDSSFGEKFNPKGAITIDEMLATMEKDGGFEGKVIGDVNACCQKKGCWMKVALGDGEEMMVRFKDYGFFVPKDLPGNTIVLNGKAYYDEISVDMLKHYAEDAGKSQEEIDAITEPQKTIAFEATGVMLHK